MAKIMRTPEEIQRLHKVFTSDIYKLAASSDLEMTIMGGMASTICHWLLCEIPECESCKDLIENAEALNKQMEEALKKLLESRKQADTAHNN